LIGFPATLQSVHSGNSVVLSWPAGASGFKLQSTASLTPPIVWTDVSIVPTLLGGRMTVTTTPSAQERYYRLTGQ